MHSNTLVSVLGALALSAAAAAQASSLIGGAVVSGAPTLLRQTNCQPARMCTPILALPTTRAGGGTAYDPIRQVVWDTDGLQIASVTYLSSGGGPCRIVCPAQPVPGLPAGAVATGLAFEEDGSGAGQLWCIDSAFQLQTFAWPTRSCPGIGTRCSVANFMPTPNHLPGGLAISEANRTIFWSASDFSGGLANNWIFGCNLANPCQPVCRLQVTGCNGIPLGPITGLAFDDCIDTMYITDGRNVATAQYFPPSAVSPCQLRITACCPATTVAGTYYGLCVEPAHDTRVGTNCLGAPCPPCPMLFSAQGDASLGNNTFAYRLSGAPPGATAFCMFNVGACTAGIPVLCGNFHVPLSPIVLSTAVTAGGACAAQAFHPLPIPLAPNLCGIPISAQDIVICAGGGFGLSNAVCTTISDT
jgi:hypothetical protein